MFVNRINHVCNDTCDYYKSFAFEVGTVYCKDILEARKYCLKCIETYDLGFTRKISGIDVTLTGCESQCNFCDADLKLDRHFSFENARKYDVVYTKTRGIVSPACFYEKYYYNKSMYKHIQNYKLSYDKISFFQEVFNKKNMFSFDCVDCGETKNIASIGIIDCCALPKVEESLSITEEEYCHNDDSNDSDDSDDSH